MRSRASICYFVWIHTKGECSPCPTKSQHLCSLFPTLAYTHHPSLAATPRCLLGVFRDLRELRVIMSLSARFEQLESQQRVVVKPGLCPFFLGEITSFPKSKGRRDKRTDPRVSCSVSARQIAISALGCFASPECISSFYSSMRLPCRWLLPRRADKK